MFGWEALADAVARVVRTLPPDERATARIYVQNYGEAGALEYFGPSRGLPPVICRTQRLLALGTRSRFRRRR